MQRTRSHSLGVIGGKECYALSLTLCGFLLTPDPTSGVHACLMYDTEIPFCFALSQQPLTALCQGTTTTMPVVYMLSRADALKRVRYRDRSLLVSSVNTLSMDGDVFGMCWIRLGELSLCSVDSTDMALSNVLGIGSLTQLRFSPLAMKQRAQSPPLRQQYGGLGAPRRTSS